MRRPKRETGKGGEGGRGEGKCCTCLHVCQRQWSRTHQIHSMSPREHSVGWQRSKECPPAQGTPEGRPSKAARGR